MTDKIPLSQILDQIAVELIEADDKARKRGRPVMNFEECEVEFDVTIEAHGDVGVKVYVVNIGGGEKKTDSNKIKVKFKAIPGAFPLQANQQIQETPPSSVRQNN